eukprot:5044549-Ditylum_brightwellii.AAC.1
MAEAKFLQQQQESLTVFETLESIDNMNDRHTCAFLAWRIIHTGARFTGLPLVALMKKGSLPTFCCNQLWSTKQTTGAANTVMILS